MIKNILARILAVWSAIAFIGTMLIFLIPIWAAGIFGEPASTVWMIRFSRMWMALYFPLSFIKAKISGKENFQPGENYIVVCNHNSFMDVPLSSPGIPGANKTIAKIEMSRSPLFGIIYKRGSVLINRKDENSRKESYQQMKDVLGSSFSFELLQLLFMMPYLKIDLLDKKGLAHRQTASSWLKKLTDAAILRPLKIGRTTYYINYKLMEILAAN